MNLFNSDLIELSMKERSPSNRLHYTSTTICVMNICTLISHLWKYQQVRNGHNFTKLKSCLA